MAATTRTGEHLLQDVLHELAWDAHLQPHEIGVMAEDGVVTLTGRVDSYAKRCAAEEAAHRVRGVIAVANDIEVHIPGSGERTDTDIAVAATQALTRRTTLAALPVEVTVAHGWLTLKGQVDWLCQRTEAERIVRGLAGVRGIANLITVIPRGLPAEIKGRIEDAFVRRAETEAERLAVEVHGGKATLKGAVSALAARALAEEATWSAPGVSAVENRLVIAP